MSGFQADVARTLIWLLVMEKLRDLISHQGTEIRYAMHEGWKLDVKLQSGQEVVIPFDPEKLDDLRAQVIALL